MTAGSLGDDQITQAVAMLPDRESGRDRAEHTRARCHAALGRRAWHGRLAQSTARLSWFRVVEPVMAGLVSAVYLSEVVRRAWSLYF
jgi:hypothetical protein